ncbi:hypothetical protein CORC01_11997 [Colletotrichum orchidophilum]|uniref:DUF3752 domain-containing protein n=1 Tax=Colletotrichum orchidophilum TaxID=1209926 RepID=A0A1G4AUE8_9PEZI|nr:uncharacterized protein CORC01_11997 [Colletotrichum orchidophilum]OHE92716.1 hypothetical protein CORC01_11997 [Colletotrichum orchidophilum]
MSSIGPQMPSHLSKRKRTPDDQGADSPRAKRNNNEEIDLDDDSDDDAYGPTVPDATAALKNSTSSKPSIGPTPPPSNLTNSSEIPLDDSDSEDGYGPTAPHPSSSTQEPPKNKPSIGPTLPPKHSIGPAMPPPDHRPAGDQSASDSDSDDDDYGPALPSSTTSVQRAQAAAVAAAATASQAPAAPQRDDWMLAPPTQSGYQERDPTKLKNRKFASGKSSAAAGGGISSIWTETPEQKRKRLEDAVLGRGDPTAAGSEKNKQPRRTKEEVERERSISENIASARGKSMYEEHQQNKKSGEKPVRDEEEEDDPSKRAFDREKDMSLGGKIGTAQRRELLNRAKDFGGRFQKGSYL